MNRRSFLKSLAASAGVALTPIAAAVVADAPLEPEYVPVAFAAFTLFNALPNLDPGSSPQSALVINAAA